MPAYDIESGIQQQDHVVTHARPDTQESDSGRLVSLLRAAIERWRAYPLVVRRRP